MSNAGGILGSIKDVADKVINTFKSSEAVDSGKEDKDKLKTTSESLEKPAIEGNSQPDKDVN